MSGIHSETAARVKGPLADATNNYSEKIQTTHVVRVIPTAWKGRRVSVSVTAPALLASGMPASCWVIFGTASTVEADRTAYITGAAPAWTGSVKIARRLYDGTMIDWNIDASWTHFSAESDLADVELQMMPTDYASKEL
jgi:hypothetical protein